MGKEVVHMCRKERELGIMATKIENIDKKTDEIKISLVEFIRTADKKYATKEELTSSLFAIQATNKRQDEDIKWTKDKIILILKDVGIVSAVIAIIAKQLGIY